MTVSSEPSPTLYPSTTDTLLAIMQRIDDINRNVNGVAMRLDGKPGPITCICAEPVAVFSAPAKRRRSGNHGRRLTAGAGVDSRQFV
jgi:hypothetical protein